MLRFSANIGFLWPDRPLLERIDAAARSGFRAVELHWPYATPADAVRARCERNGVTLLNINSPRGDVDSGEFGLAAVPGREAAFAASMDDAIAYAVSAGARAIHVIAGIVLPGGEARAADVLAANLAVAADMAAAHGLTLYLEPMATTVRPGYFYSTADAAAAMIRRVGKPTSA